jgi:hypothetical protein
MNYGSPLNKDQKVKKEEQPQKEKPRITKGGAKRILGRSVGEWERGWVNRWVENQVRGRCLPLSVWSDSFLSEIENVFGAVGASDFHKQLLADFERERPRIS